MPHLQVNDVEIYHDRFGSPDDPQLLLLAGLGSQATNYPEPFCQLFVDHGLGVIRMDNRDAGLSSEMPDDSSYTLIDMAADVTGLIEALGCGPVHLWGSSMGGMIAQEVALARPDLLRSLISVQSTTGEPGVGEPTGDALERMLETMGPVGTVDDAVAAALRQVRILMNNDELYDAEYETRRQRGFVERSYRPAGSARQTLAVLSTPPRAERLRGLRLPTLVIHGGRDPLIDPSGGRRTAELVDGARYVEIDEMGHDLSRPLWPRFAEIVAEFVAAVDQDTE